MSKTRELITECQRLSESCLYTSTTFYEFLKSIRFWNRVLTIVPLVLAAASTWELAKVDGNKWVTGVCALLAALIPTVHQALKLSASIKEVETAATEYKNLQDRFRQTAMVYSRKTFSEFEGEFALHMERLEKARALCITPPERFFKAAQAKVKSGDYTFDVDLEESGATKTPVGGPVTKA